MANEEHYAQRVARLTGVSVDPTTLKCITDILREAHDQWTSNGAAMVINSDRPVELVRGECACHTKP